jgi:GNAT superfamily N-acetyltransferase
MPHLVQLNVATLRQPIEHPATKPFVDALEAVNAAGDAAPGFVWRLQTDGGDATSIQVFPNPLTIVNLTVWESIEALRDYAYRGVHVEFFRRRAEWFEPDASASALWWLPEGELPTEADAVRRLAFIESYGSSPFAFRIGQRQAQFVVRRTALPDSIAEALIVRLNTELSAMYPEPGANHFRLDPADVEPGVGGFFVGTLDGAAVSTGAYRFIEPGVAEVKRMFIDPSCRGLKLGAAMLDTVEADAARFGATRMVLETGIRQDEALGLYGKAGYRRVDCWGDYAASAATSVCMEKPLNTDGG